MPISFNYNINTIKKINENGLENAIVQVYWTFVGTNELGRTSELYGTSTFTTADLNSVEDFIPFNEVTDETIISWVQNAVSEEHESHMKAVISQQLGQDNS